MEFNKAYEREEFLQFLRVNFLPEDFIDQDDNVILRTQTKYTQSAVKLGVCKSLDLVVYEIKHSGKEDPRVGLSKEAFRLLADEWQNRALVLFVPQDNNANYRFSLITIDLKEGTKGHTIREYSNPHRCSYLLGEGIGGYTPNKYLYSKGRIREIKDLQERFSTEVLTKAFYQELSDWYAWAINIVKFPNNIEDDSDDTKYNTESVIRLITRLIFVWFLKQRKLVPDEFFDEGYIRENLIEKFNPHVYQDLFSKSQDSIYYKAIMQNLFFAMLNSPITPEGKDTITERQFKKDRNGFDNNKLMRYYDKFTNPDLFLKLANDVVPFLNGGLFECLDDKQNKMYIDGFSDRDVVQNHLIIPDYLFFGEEAGKDIDLSEFYGDSKKKKVSARGIIDILNRYNFTVEENTPFDQEVSLDPELLGKVFENLLASFNPETKTTARKQTGSFYTPREIVQYMVDESLLAHFKRTVGEELEDEYRKLMRYTDEQIDLSEKQKKAIMQSLYGCKILDPACGSGAFPMGILQQMVHILSQLDPNNNMWKEILMQDAINETTEAYKNASSEERAEVITDIERSFNDNVNRPDYARKLYLIESCIFGVDIQPIAIQISKLRFFISLVVDQKTNKNPADNFGIRPLPNLEAKFVAANTLIGLNKKEATLFDTAEIKAKENDLKDAKHKIFGAKTSRTKNKWRTRVAELRTEIAEALKSIDAIGNIEAQQLANWDMFDQNTSSPFFDSEWMFGVKDGFDIVIGNPPYVQLQTNGGFLADQLKDCKYKSFARTGDIYSLFYERGWQVLKKDGHLCYITSNKWMRAGYGESTRKFFAEKTNPKLLIDFSGVKIFDSATVDTNILLFSKSNNEDKTVAVVAKKEDKDCIKELSVFVQQQHSVYSFNTSDSWVILSPIEQSIKRKIESVGTPLKDWDINIYRGVLTGFNEAFIISTEKREEILANCQTDEERDKTAELIRPILRGRDIKRYSYDYADLWLIATFPSRHYDIEEYQAVKEYLLSFAKETLISHNYKWIANNATLLSNFCMQKIAQTGKAVLVNDQAITFGNSPEKARKRTSNKWFETQDSISYWDDFFKPKIVYPNMTKFLPFYLDYKGFYQNDKSFMITGDKIYFLTAFLNSSLFKFCYIDNFPELQGGTRELRKIFFDKIPVLKIDESINNEFRLLVEEIQSAYTKEKAKMIDIKLFDLYKLTEEERRLIGYIEIN